MALCLFLQSYVAEVLHVKNISALNNIISFKNFGMQLLYIQSANNNLKQYKIQCYETVVGKNSEEGGEYRKVSCFFNHFYDHVIPCFLGR
jgi:hypothetical protein